MRRGPWKTERSIAEAAATASMGASPASASVRVHLLAKGLDTGGVIETHVLMASREVARRNFQGYLDLRARRERRAPEQG